MVFADLGGDVGVPGETGPGWGASVAAGRSPGAASLGIKIHLAESRWRRSGRVGARCVGIELLLEVVQIRFTTAGSSMQTITLTAPPR